MLANQHQSPYLPTGASSSSSASPGSFSGAASLPGGPSCARSRSYPRNNHAECVPESQNERNLKKQGRLATNSFKVGGQPATNSASSPADICPITVAPLAAASSTAFLNGDVVVIDFVQHFSPDAWKVAPLVVSMLTLSMSDSAKPVTDKLYEAEVRWTRPNDSPRPSSTTTLRG